jgi:predicted PurR-regulated permease PerM
MPFRTHSQRRRTEVFLGTMALLLLIGGCFLVLRPFLSSLVWAIVLAYSLHPLQRRFTHWLRGSRTLAACLVTLTIALVLAGPVVLIGFSLAKDAKALGIATREWVLSAPESAPSIVANLPVIGDELSGYWTELATSRKRWLDDMERLAKSNGSRTRSAAGTAIATPPPLKPAAPIDPDEAQEAEREESPGLVLLLGRLLAWTRNGLIAVGLALGHGVTQVLLSAFLAFFLLRDAPVLAERLGVVIDRLAGGGRGAHLMEVAGDTVRGVVYGILGTALVQALVAGIGFAVAGVPGAVLLGVLTFFFAIIPFGPPLIWLPAAFWLVTQGSPGWALFMLIWGALGISSVDNFLRPYLISQGSKMPFALVFCGVIGGALAFGVVGVFLGPTLLAVGFRLIEEWSTIQQDISRLPVDTSSRMERDGGDSGGVG